MSPALIRCTLLLVLLAPPALRAQTTPSWQPLTYAPAPADNPLKGFMPYNGVYSTFPHSMEYYYVAWKDIQTDYATFSWSAIDIRLVDVAARGHHVVFRVYADYPKLAYGVPAFLDSIPRHAYTDNGNTTSFSPDYDNPNLRRAMLATIAAMGARYDGDQRIGFIEVGFLGFWGEWHTYPHTEWFASTATQNMVLDAFERAFHRTKLVMREPKAGTNMPARAIGYHDDSFCYSTFGSIAGAGWYFWPKILAAGEREKWRTQSIGGELRPEIQLSLWSDACTCTNGEDGLAMQSFDRCVDSTHASWQLAHSLFVPGNTGTAHIRALAGARRMGYELFVSAVCIPDVVTDVTVPVSLTIMNKGVAPFPYRWTVELGLVNDQQVIVARDTTAWDLRMIVDTAAVILLSPLALPGVPPGRYTVLMRARPPLPGGKPLAFANATWNKDVTGWLSLASVTVATPTGVTNPNATPSTSCELLPNFPNPFNPLTTIRYHLAAASHVRLCVYDRLGRLVATLVHAWRSPGTHEEIFDARMLASGTYLCRLEAGPFVRTRALVILQ